MKKALLFGLFFSLFSLASFAQTDNEFWFAVPFATPNHDGPVKANLVITMHTYGDTIVVEQPYGTPAFAKRQIKLNAGQTYQMKLDSFMFNNPNNSGFYINGYPSGAVNATSWNDPKAKGNYALHIYSKHPSIEFSCYYEQDPSATAGGRNNPDIWTLKGKNALGKEFYIPFQTTWVNNYNSAWAWPAYSAYDIVATSPGVTTVTITNPKVDAAGHPANTPFTVTLNQGQTYSVAPRIVTEGNGLNVPSRATADKLAGAHVTSNQPIAITTKDDSEVKSSAYDMIGDQLVPLTNLNGDKLIGLSYIVMRGQLSNLSATQGEGVYITATANNTKVYVSDISGVDSLLATLSAGQQATYIIPPSKTSISVRGTSPIYVFHVSGFVHEMGGALIPSIDGCTGSLEVSFVRSIGGPDPNCSNTSLNQLFLNIMTKVNAIDSFYYSINNGPALKLGNASWFSPVGTTGWYALKNANRCFSTIPPGVTVKVWNTEDVFHLGVINGIYSGGGCRYGYFSNYNEIKAKAVTIESGTNLLTNCELDTVQLQASGGIMYRYQWFPTTYLIDPPTIANPRAVVPRGWTDFYCKIKQPCFGFDTLRITVFSPENPFAFFTVDKSETCYTDTIIHIENKSENATKYRWTFGDGTGVKYYSSAKFDYPYSNRTNAPKVFQIYLETENSDGCLSNFKVPITVNPFLKANFTTSDTVVCHPLDTVHYKQPIVFTNKSYGNVTDTSYIWNFDDGNSTDNKSPRHLFYNFSNPKDTVFNVRLVATSPFYCRDTAWQKITVHPYIKAMFTVDSVKGCSPMEVKIHNKSEGAISSYSWDFGDGTIRTDNKDTLNHFYPRNLTNHQISYKILLTVSHKFGNGCPDTISRTITVYPEGKVDILNPDTIGCNSTTVKYRVQADAGVNQYIWDFGDGNTSNLITPTHEFVNLSNADITYKVTLRTFSDQYCGGLDSMKVTVHANLDPQFSIDVPATCTPYNATFTNKSQGGITSYLWDFDDGSAWGTSGASSFIHQYRNTLTTPIIRNVKLVVQNSGGCKDSVSHPITLYPEVHAQFTTTAGAYCSPRRFDFSNQSNTVATKFVWKFGDGSTSLARDTSHLYENRTNHDTIFYAYLVAMSDNFCKDSTTTTQVIVYPYVEPYFALDTTAGCNPLTVKIMNGSVGPYTTESWDFNNGLPPSGAQPKSFSHLFTNSNLYSNRNYIITLRIAYKGICLKSYFKPVTVYAPIIPKVSNNISTVCNNSEITFKDSTNRPPIPYNYRWDFGDGGSVVGVYGPNRSLPVITKHQFDNFQTVYKSLKVSFYGYSQYGCVGDTSININVMPEVKASFSFDDPAGCSPLAVPLKNGSTSTATWVRFWDDENTPSSGFPATSIPATHTFLNNIDTVSKIYKPKLKVAYIYNGNPVCPDSITRTITIYPQVTAYFAAKDSFKICHPGSVNFGNRSRIGNYILSPTNNKLTYKWFFGDNGSSSDYEPAHLYYNYDNALALVDTVTLTATSQYLCSSTLKKIVTIYPKPKAIFDVENSIACPPFKVEIDHSSLAETGSLFTWQFNDGGPDTVTRKPVETLYHLFSNGTLGTKTFPVQLSINTPHNCTATTSQDINVYPRVKADFDKDSAGCNPFIVAFKDKSQQADSWYWDFGDKLNSKTQSPQHTFFNYSINDTTFRVKLRATSKFLCYHDTFRRITVYPQPVANFEADRYYFTYSPTNNIVNFTNQTNVGNWNYAWNFDDQTAIITSAGPIVRHDYQPGAPNWGGRYNVQLTASSIHCIDSISHRITIVAPKPIADFTTSANGCVPLTVSLNNLSDYTTSWLWEYGDGGTYSGPNPPPYVYTRSGKFNIKLTTVGPGGTSYAFKDIEVFPKPKVNFDLKPRLVMLTEKLEAPVQFYNKCELGVRFLWEFGDSTKSQDLAPLHIYKSIGSYSVKLGAWTVNQCYDEILKKDTVLVLERHEIQFPNAFTPNTSGRNDGKYSTPDTKNEVFHPSWTGIVEYHLEIYARWGEKLFESNDVNVGWNGYYKGKLCSTDVYIWKAKGKYTDGGTFEKAGNVTLLR